MDTGDQKKTATLAGNREIAESTYLFRFNTHNGFSFTPGQYLFIRLPRLLHDDPRGPRRHFSIVNSPNEKNVIEIATRVRGSGFKQTLLDMQPGSEVELGPLQGDFTIPQAEQSPIVFLSGGIGVTPFISMLRYVEEEKLNHRIKLLFSNRTQSSTAFLEELQSREQRMPNFELVLTMDGDETWQGEKRKLDAGFIRDYVLDLDASLFMIAGPPPMVNAMKDMLAELKVPREHVKAENFAGY